MGKITYKAHQIERGIVPEKSTAPVSAGLQYVPQQINVEQQELIDASQQIFDRIVTREYLHELNKCHVLPISSEVTYPQVRWYKVDKIVKEKDVFFTDKLSMLYMSLHKTAKNVILVLNKQNDGDVELYLGARDFSGSSRVSGEILEAGLEGYFPGICFKKAEFPSLSFLHPSVSAVSAIASLRDDKKEDFVQGIERLINATSSIPQFRAFFIADSVSNSEVGDMIRAFNNLYTSLSPAETLQLTFGASETKGVSQSFSKTFSESIGESISKTITHTDGYSETNTEANSRSEGSNENYSRNILTSIWNGIKGGKTGRGKNTGVSNSYSSAIGKNFSDSEADQTGSNSTKSQGTNNQIGENESKTENLSKQITYKNQSAKFYLGILEKQLDRLQKGRPFGLWSVATYFVANDPTTAQQLSNIYRGSIIGEESGLETCAVNTWTDVDDVNTICSYLSRSLHPRFDYGSLDVSAGSVVNSKELAIHLSLPQTSVPGIIVEEKATFARNVFQNYSSENKIALGNVLHLGRESSTPVKLDVEELTKHIFVTGSTGSGKSNAVYLLLRQLREKGIKFMVVEPAKGEYKHVFGCLSDVTVYSNTNKVGEILKINPFAFPYNKIDVLEHIDRLVEIFNACWPMYAAMPAVLKHSIIKAYEKCGWDVTSSTHNLSTVLFPRIEDVVLCLKEYLDASEYSEETKGDYKGALQVRLQDLCEGMYGQILNSDSINDEALFNNNVIVDLSRIGSQETKALLMGLLVMKLNEFRMAEGGMNTPIKHITVLEEAHNLLKRTSTEQSQESSNVTGKSVEMISNSIAEMRTYGESFMIVDQSPSLLDPLALRNTNTKIILALPDLEDRKSAGGSISLTGEQIDEISKQKRGEAIVYQNVWESPVQCKVAKFVEYKPKYIYNKQSNQLESKARRYNIDVINFLLYSHIETSFDINKLREELYRESIPVSLKYAILTLVDEYQKYGKIAIWEDCNFIDAANMVRKYMNMEAEYYSLTRECSNMQQFRAKCDRIIRDLLSPCPINLKTIYFIEMCYVRNNAQYQDWLNTFM